MSMLFLKGLITEGQANIKFSQSSSDGCQGSKLNSDSAQFRPELYLNEQF